MKRLLVVAAILGFGVAACGGAGSSNWKLDEDSSKVRAKNRKRVDVKRCNKGEAEWCFAAGIGMSSYTSVMVPYVAGVPRPALLLEAPEIERGHSMAAVASGVMFEKGCKLGHLASCVLAAEMILRESNTEKDVGTFYRGNNKARAKAMTAYAEKACQGAYLSGCELLMQAAALAEDKEKEIWATERVCDLGGNTPVCPRLR